MFNFIVWSLSTILFVQGFIAKNGQRSNRIIGGTATTIEKHPHVVALLLEKEGQLFLRCGGSIINEDWILSAAHCEAPVDFEGKMWVRAGSSSYRTGGQLSRVAGYVAHEQFVDLFLWDDIGLARLETSLQLGAAVRPISIAQQLPAAGQMLDVAGWGLLDEFDTTSIPDILHEVQLPIWDDESCLDHYWLVWTDVQFCAGGTLAGDKGVCFGDSGSPMVYGGEVVGLTSGGEVCAGSLTPSVFTRVPHYIEWLKMVLENGQVQDNKTTQ